MALSPGVDRTKLIKAPASIRNLQHPLDALATVFAPLGELREGLASVPAGLAEGGLLGSRWVGEMALAI